MPDASQHHDPRSARRPGTLVDLAVRLRRDEAIGWDELTRRDRAIGQVLGLDEKPQDFRRKAEAVAGWLTRVEPAVDLGRPALAKVGAAAVLLGLLLGYGSAVGLFYYDGSSPVNVVSILAVYVGLQAVTLVLFTIAAWPAPGSEWLRGLSSGRFVAWVLRWLPAETRETVGSVFGLGLSSGSSSAAVYRRVRKWQILTWSQSLALWFNVAAVAGALSLIVFSDLGFGWSTTLDVDASVMHGLTSALALPFGWWVLDAVPPLGLVESTQAFRAEGFELPAEAAESARWWPFVVGCMVVYGVGPRVVTLGMARWYLGRATRRAVAGTPGVERVLARMTSAVVRTSNGEDEVAAVVPDGAAVVRPASGSPAAVVCWAGADGPTDALRAGGGRTLDEDRAVIESVSQAEGAVQVRVRAWEPPVLEVLDFLRDLRGVLGVGPAVEVLPVGEGDVGVWRRRVSSLGDRETVVVVERGGAEVGGDYENDYENENDKAGGEAGGGDG
ncbi:MAG: DUF2868 domain-containing protein [Planctomycetota bacterium]